jgi:hypothetical protein
MKKTKLIKRKNTKKYNIKTKMKLRKLKTLRKSLQNGGMEKEYNRPSPKKILESKPSALKLLTKEQIIKILMKRLQEKKKLEKLLKMK